METSKKKLLYEITFSVLALVAVIIATLDIMGKINLTTNKTLYIVDILILIIFALDYFIRLYLSDNKKQFIRKNIPDLIAIIPFSSFFKVFRMAKLLRFTKFTKVLRLAGVGGKFYKNAEQFLKTNGLIYALSFTLIIMLICSVAISIVEKMTFPDAVWWSFVTATTVGYGDISPSTGVGRLIAGFLMLVGIGTIGMITGTIATYFLTEKETLSEESPIKDMVEASSDLTDIEKREVIQYINYVKNRRSP